MAGCARRRPVRKHHRPRRHNRQRRRSRIRVRKDRRDIVHRRHLRTAAGDGGDTNVGKRRRQQCSGATGGVLTKSAVVGVAFAKKYRSSSGRRHPSLRRIRRRRQRPGMVRHRRRVRVIDDVSPNSIRYVVRPVPATALCVRSSSSRAPARDGALPKPPRYLRCSRAHTGQWCTQAPSSRPPTAHTSSRASPQRTSAPPSANASATSSAPPSASPSSAKCSDSPSVTP